jgi:phosphoribosyl-ATP pyrophosphohydrolase
MVVKPLIIADTKGNILDATVMNHKAYNKSTEHGRLWHVHADTGRVLPYRVNLAFKKLTDTADLYRVVVDADEWTEAVSTSGAGQARTIGPDSKSSHGTDGQADISGAGANGWGLVLSQLVDVIHDRKETLPEGSYTSYLFGAGESKIRKKTGEEAIELILATTAEETASEAADLIYHLLVLLEELHISFDQVVQELESRT